MMASENDNYYQVTSRFEKLESVMSTLQEAIHFHFDEVKGQLASQKRNDASVPNDKVRELLQLAKLGGMSQRDFENASSKLRPNSESRYLEGFRGSLWNHYIATNARMSCTTFQEYAGYFVEEGWVSFEDAREFVLYAFAVEAVVEAGVPQTSESASAIVDDLLLRDLLRRVFTEASPRTVGAMMRVYRKLLKETPEIDRSAVTQDFRKAMLFVVKYAQQMQREGRAS